MHSLHTLIHEHTYKQNQNYVKISSRDGSPWFSRLSGLWPLWSRKETTLNVKGPPEQNILSLKGRKKISDEPGAPPPLCSRSCGVHMDVEEPLQGNNHFSLREKEFLRSVLTNSNQRHCCHIEKQSEVFHCSPEEPVVSLQLPPDFKNIPAPFLNMHFWKDAMQEQTHCLKETSRPGLLGALPSQSEKVKKASWFLVGVWNTISFW